MAKEVKESKIDLTESNSILKKIFIVLVIIACIIGINTIIILAKGGYSNFSSTGGNNGEESNNGEGTAADYDTSMFTEIKASDIVKQTKGKAKVVYIGRATCSWCAKLLPHLQKAQKDLNFKTLYIDIAKMIDFNTNMAIDQEAINLISNLATSDDLQGYMDENFGATPMVLVIKDSKIIAAQTGYTEYAALKSFLNANGFK